MKKYKKLKILLLILAISVLGLIGYNVYINYQYKTNSSCINAKIIDIERITKRYFSRGAGGSNISYLIIKYEYKVNNKRYTKSKEITWGKLLIGMPINLNKGDSIPIVYLKNIPEISKLSY